MFWNSRPVIIAGLLLLAHACYSAQEHAALQAFQAASSLTAGTYKPSGSILPTDIIVETVMAMVIVCLGLILRAPDLRPTQWRVWAGKMQKEYEVHLAGRGDRGNGYLGNPFSILESRPGFVDVRKQRQEFGDWVKGGELVVQA
ncbi:hypothetical protein ACRALDRAFT_1042794 [Sodiomyces alcalophilus JCM 7366]|uniref:uncharacterized protein n=1 Tax=Sodiomyces alcalophilus JCM 7366 TaxID=591952 RepID=UPI0039B4E91C